MINKKEITDLYLRYGFEKGPEHEKYLVFFSQRGYFQNTEIVILDDTFDSDTIDKSEYESIGYSVRIKKFENITQAHNELFNGFFNILHSNKKLRSEYNSFCEQQKQKLPISSYEYVSGNYIENSLIHDGCVVDRILEILNSDERQLIILEASAGYGKTCTSFEVIKNIIEKMETKIPLLAELSKNRKASVFRYVLLSEIDQKFPTLSSELVTSEIQDGRIILIIDGFDELLSKSYSSQQDYDKTNIKEAQTMLDTIAQLIPKQSKTKILLTSRKSSIFVGENYDNWVSQKLSGCNVTRIQLPEPSIRDWIGAEKIDALEKNKLDLSNILNPVLLTFLRNEPVENIEKIYISNDVLIEKYLDLLLCREKTRQDLPLSVDEQLNIMCNLAAQMVKMDISVEEMDFIKMIITEIVEPQIDEFLKRYDYIADSSEHKPTENEFVSKISQHTLLDRVSTQNNLIGFINDYIFGIMIAKAILEEKMPVNELQGKYLDLLITSYSSYSLEKRKKMYNILKPILEKESAQRQLSASILLNDRVNGDFSGEYFDGILFSKKLPITDTTFVECIFSDCIFDQCIINTDVFKCCQFYNCSFYDVEVILGDTLNCELSFLACFGHDNFAKLSHRVEKAETNTIDYNKLVLEQFWKPGYERAEPNRAYAALLKGFASNEKQKISETIEDLVRKNILIKKIRVYELNFEKIDEIREIIGR